MSRFEVKIGEEFKPSPKLKTLYYIYLVIAALLLISPWCIPLMFLAPFIIPFISIPILPIIILIAYWIPRYYDSITYKLTEREIICRRGVWFKMTGIVPYDRITNIDIIQGPIARRLGIASLRIQTAGYSGQAGAEIRMDGIEHFRELRDLIMDFVKGKRPVAVGVYEEKDVTQKILDELIMIRKLLEKMLETRSQ